MKKKSGHRRRTKVVRRSRKNLRRTVKRKSVGKSRRRPTRRYSRVQRGGLTEEELKELKVKANSGVINAMKSLYKHYYYTRIDNNALKYLQQAATAGDAEAQYNLGCMYEYGENVQGYIGVVRDDAKAVELYQLAADQGHAGAQYNLGNMFREGKGVVRDDAKAVELYQLAAAQGDAEAQYNLGMMFAKGEGVAQDDAEALKYFKLVLKNVQLKKAVLGKWLEYVSDNIYSIMSGDSDFYNNDDDVKTFQYEMGKELGNTVKAVRWYELASEQGHAGAQFALGRLFLFNYFGNTDFGKAFKYLYLAADQGYPEAEYYVGEMYQDGKGVKKNEKEALRFYRLAAFHNKINRINEKNNPKPPNPYTP